MSESLVPVKSEEASLTSSSKREGSPNRSPEKDLQASLEQLFAASDSAEDSKTEPSPVSERSAQDVEVLGGEVQVKADEEGRSILARTARVKTVKYEPILWNHVPSARDEAGLAFQELETCTYQSKDYGETGQEEMMSCDCKPEIGKFTAAILTSTTDYLQLKTVKIMPVVRTLIVLIV